MLSNTEIVDTTRRYIRIIMGTIDRIVYSILGSIIDVFFAVASQEIIKGDVLKSLIGRFQLIVGVAFLFIFAVHIVRGIINPDLFIDSNKGTAKVVSKIIIALFLFASMIPLNIPNPEAGSYEEQLANQGILFGTMAHFQNVVLKQNILARLVLGNSGGNNNGSFGFQQCRSVEDENGEMVEECTDDASFGQYMATTIAKLFVFPNMMPGATSIEQEVDGNLFAICIDDEGFYNEDESDESKRGRYQWYVLEDRPAEIFGYVDNECTVSEDVDFVKLFASVVDSLHNPFGAAFSDIDLVRLQGEQHWQFQYLSPLSTIVGVVLIFMMISTTVEIAVRMFKLVILRVLGPIAAITYAGPGDTSKTFESWATNLATTFLDIFVRLLIIYFILFVMSGMLTSGVDLDGVGLLGMIFIIIALFYFAKKAPNYIRQVLGLPESSNGMFGGLFGGIGNMLAAGGAIGGTIAGLGATGLGAIGAARNAALSSREADEERKRLGENVDPDAFGNRAKHFLAGALGFGQGATRGVRATLGADKDKFGAAYSAITELNALKASRGRVGSTLLGRVNESVGTLGTGRSRLENYEKEIARGNAVSDSANKYADYSMKKGATKFGDQARTFTITRADGTKQTYLGTLNDYRAKLQNARNDPKSTGFIKFGSGKDVAVNGEEADDILSQMQGQLGASWTQDELAKHDAWEHAARIDADGTHYDSSGNIIKDGDAGALNYVASLRDNGVQDYADEYMPGLIGSEAELLDGHKAKKVGGGAKGNVTRTQASADYNLLKANQHGGPK